jgi:hypothetical protein
LPALPHASMPIDTQVCPEDKLVCPDLSIVHV